jgi:HK97 family phage major capsid protein
MTSILELREKRGNLVASARAVLDKASGGILSADDEQTYQALDHDIEALTSQIQRMEKQTALEQELSKPTTAPITQEPGKALDTKTGRASEEYRKAFGNVLRGRGVSNVLQTTTDPDGGYLVPVEFDTALVTRLTEANVMRQLCKVITTSCERKIPVQATTATAAWTAENANIADTTLTFDQTFLDAFKIATAIKVSNELLSDAFFDLESYIAAQFAEAFAAKEEEAFLVGTGTGQPTGLFTASGAEVGVTGTATLNADNIIELVYSLKAPYRRNAKFLMNDATIALIRKFKDSNGSFMWQPSLTAGQPDRLLGYEIYTSPYAPLVAAGAYPIAFGDFSNYWIADRQGTSLKRLNELFSLNDQIGFVATKRVDGKTILAEGIKLLQSGT